MTNILWRMTALGDLAFLKSVVARLDEADPVPALAWSVFEDGPAPAGRMDVLFDGPIDEAAFRARWGLTEDGLEIDYSPMPNEDWVRLSLAGLKPVEAGRFVLFGSHDADNLPEGAIRIEIEAGPAFGTGHHGTTKGCLEAFDALLDTPGFAPARLLDLGCGTGALAIAAAKTLPEAEIIMSDIDEDSVAEAHANAMKNGARGIEALQADGFGHPALQDPFDLIFANILAGPLIGLAGDIERALAPGGRVILSGLLTEQEPGVRDAYEAVGLTVSRSEPIDGWETLVAVKAG